MLFYISVKDSFTFIKAAMASYMMVKETKVSEENPSLGKLTNVSYYDLLEYDSNLGGERHWCCGS